MKVNFLFSIFIFIACCILSYSCAVSRIAGRDQLSIQLHWAKGFETETKENVVTGLAWSLSFLGAALPQGSMNQALEWQNESTFSLDLSVVGFSKRASAALRDILAELKSSEEYKRRGKTDLGRFVALSLTCSNYYYAITDAKKNYNGFLGQFNFSDTLTAIVESGIAKGNRLVKISEGSTLNSIAFVAHEGIGSIQDHSFKSSEFEVFDFMENGQIRFAIYDSLGRLKSSGSPSLTNAGKPSKCLWCHESGIHLPFLSKTNVNGYFTIEQFANKVNEKMKVVDAYREKLKADIDFSKRQDHTKAELLYLAFMEPSAQRLAQEWQMDLQKVKILLQTIPAHSHVEFKFLGNELYHRKDIDNLAPYQSLRVADDPRENSFFEPDYVHR